MPASTFGSPRPGMTSDTTGPMPGALGLHGEQEARVTRGSSYHVTHPASYPFQQSAAIGHFAPSSPYGGHNLARTSYTGAYIHSPSLHLPRHSTFVPGNLSPVHEGCSSSFGANSLCHHSQSVCQHQGHFPASPATGQGASSFPDPSGQVSNSSQHAMNATLTHVMIALFM